MTAQVQGGLGPETKTERVLGRVSVFSLFIILLAEPFSR